MGVSVSPVVRSSPRISPIAGPNWTPWPEKPKAWNRPGVVRLGPAPGRAAGECGSAADGTEVVLSRRDDVSKDGPYWVKTTLAKHYRRYQVLRRLRAEDRSLNGLGAKDISALYPGVPSNDGKGILFISHLGEVFPSGFLPLSVGYVNRRHVVEHSRDSDLLSRLRALSPPGR